MKVSRVDHIHIKVDELEKTTEEYEKVFGFSFPPIIDFTDRSGFKVVFNQFPNGIELMKVVDNTKPMARLYNEAPVGVFALSLNIFIFNGQAHPSPLNHMVRKSSSIITWAGL